MPSVKLECKSIAELPSPEHLANDSRLVYTTFPVVCLALCKLPEWNFGFLLVTDFTDNDKNAYAAGRLPQRLPESFSLGDIHALEQQKVFPVTVPASKVDLYWSELCKFSPHMKQYNPRDEMKCNFSEEGVICSLNMRVKEYRGELEGWISTLEVCNRESLNKPTFRNWIKNCGFGNFMARYLAHVDERLYNRLLPNFPIDAYLQPGDFSSEKGGYTTSKKRHDDELLTQAPKTRKISAAQVTFQQQFTQKQPVERQRVAIQEPCSSSEDELTQHSQVSTNGAFQRSQWQDFTVNSVSFSTLASFTVHNIPDATAFETTVLVSEILPDINMLFVRPFKRTIKIQPFKLVLKGKDDKVVLAELHSESELNHFFGIEETEEIINKLDKVSTQLTQLKGSQVRIRLIKSFLNLSYGYRKAYWTCQTPLNELLEI
ncbi:hypothetical protein FDK38_004298 [Candidozyma auris]|nr:hypothetical protein FDK38_004298 [[Candida] auris]